MTPNLRAQRDNGRSDISSRLKLHSWKDLAACSTYRFWVIHTRGGEVRHRKHEFEARSSCKSMRKRVRRKIEAQFLFSFTSPVKGLNASKSSRRLRSRRTGNCVYGHDVRRRCRFERIAVVLYHFTIWLWSRNLTIL